ncbi:Gfo/Idh/MocA family protein [Pseudactinotalea sp. Z1732]|uniref:Gfo/Idh/MocA family protein n=1 Tax=Micrococcales TaxID=85006 RepID=UPI003C7C2524
MGQPLNVGIIGCGNISRQYLDNLRRLGNLNLTAVSDVHEPAARAVADAEGVPALQVTDLLQADTVDVVLNLTTPTAHAPLALAAFEAGKHVYLEKPFATTPTEAEELMSATTDTGLRLGSAPDTVLGTGIQTARALVDEGRIGAPVGATAFMLAPGHEFWHPNPAYYYAAGGGPLLDMGVYYLTALVTMLGPVRTVAAMAGRARTERIVPEGAPRAGEVLPVSVDTFTSALLQHAGGAISTLVVSFDVVATEVPRIEVYGAEGSIAVPDPNQFDGDVRLGRVGSEFTPVAPLAGYRDAGRGYGLADMARAVDDGGPHRQSAELGFHVHEVMDRIAQAAEQQAVLTVHSTCERPAPVPLSDDPALN